MPCDVSALINGIVKFVLDRWLTCELQLKVTWWLVTKGEGIFSAFSLIPARQVRVMVSRMIYPMIFMIGIADYNTDALSFFHHHDNVYKINQRFIPNFVATLPIRGWDCLITTNIWLKQRLVTLIVKSAIFCVVVLIIRSRVRRLTRLSSQWWSGWRRQKQTPLFGLA